jgi:hypothetical protein
MGLLKDLQKNIKTHHLIALLGAIVLIAALSQYSGRKNAAHEGMDTPSDDMQKFDDESKEKQDKFYQTASGAHTGPVEPANPAESDYASAAGVTTSTMGLPPSCNRNPTTDPKELLPNDSNSEFARLNPKGANDLSQVNLLSAGYHRGINTVGGSLRNANLQVRSEPPNPTNKVSPWGNSTIEPDLMRVPLELGCTSN